MIGRLPKNHVLHFPTALTDARCLRWFSLAVCLTLPAYGCTAGSDSPASTVIGDGDGAAAVSKGDAGTLDVQKVEALIAERARLDETVWAPEIAAQLHESVFVRLWDRLRLHDDDVTLLGDLNCDRFTLGRLQEFFPVEQGIEVASTGSGLGDLQLTASDWKTWLRKMYRRGYRLAQSEWHHEAFQPAGDQGPARSTIVMTLHVTNTLADERLQIEGTLDVEWDYVRSARDYHIHAMDASRLTLLRRAGPAPFRESVVIDLGPIKGIETWSDILVFDLTGDRLPDVVHPESNRWFVNQGGFSLLECNLASRPLAFVSEAVLGDFTGDGQIDLLCAGARERDDGRISLWLYHGRGDHAGHGTALFASPSPQESPGLRRALFEGEPLPAITERLELKIPDAIATGDVDRDGDLDIFVTQYKQPYRNGQVPTPYFDANDGWPAYLLLGDGHGHFSDATISAGFGPKRHRRTYRSSFVDLDGDNDLDLLVTNDFAGFDVYHNDGHGNFTDVSTRVVDETAVFGMSHTLSDFNRDGRLDFFVVGMASTTARRLSRLGLGREEFPQHQAMRNRMAYGNRLYLRDTRESYRRPEWSGEVARSGWSWGVAAEDFDLDNDVDLYIANGHQSGRSALDYCTRFWCHDIYFAGSDESRERHKFLVAETRHVGESISWNGYEKNHFFLQGKTPSSDDPSTAENRAVAPEFYNVAFLLGLAEEADCRHVAAADFDRDGLPDLLLIRRQVVDREGRLNLVLHRNALDVKGRRWIGVDLPIAGGSSPFGTTVAAVTSSGRMVDAYVAGDSFGVQHPPTLHFGLGRQDTVREIQVRWPNGQWTMLPAPVMDRYHQLERPQ